METPAWLDRTQWPWPPHAVAVADGRLHFVEEGHGPPVVLVHGTPTWAFEWRHVIAGLRGSYRVVAPDHLGFGLSDRPAAVYTPEAHAARFREFMARVVPAGDVRLVVHDFGGPIALDWALDHPDRLAHLVIVNSWMWPFDEDRAMTRRAALAGSALGRWLYRRFNASQRLIMPSAYADRTRLTPAIHRQYLAVFPDPASRERVLFALAVALLGSRAHYASLWARRDRLARVAMSIVWGMRDSAFPPSMLATWEHVCPHAEVTRLADAGHWPHEEQPAAVVRALAAAFARDRAAT